MSLAIPADGLLETHVTWEDVEETMTSALNTKARFGPNKKATNISDMKGFMSRVALIEPDWIDASEDETLPQRFVAKLSSQLAFIHVSKIFGGETWSEEKLEQFAHLTREVHNREIGAYKILAKANSHLIPYPKAYALEPFTDDNKLKAYIISEFVDVTNPVYVYEAVPADDLIPAVKAVAAFSALGEKFPEDELSFARGVNVLQLMFDQIVTEKSIAHNNNVMRTTMDKKYDEKVEKFIKASGEFYMNRKILEKFDELYKDYPKVLTHGDIGIHNMLFSRNEDGSVKFHALIDYQVCSFSSAATDLGRLLLMCLNTKDRRAKGGELIKIYYDTFVEELEGRPAPYTFQQLQDSFDLYFPMTVALMLPALMPFVTSLGIPEEKKQYAIDITMDKLIGLLEDGLEVHERNLERFPDFFKF